MCENLPHIKSLPVDIRVNRFTCELFLKEHSCALLIDEVKTVVRMTKILFFQQKQPNKDSANHCSSLRHSRLAHFACDLSTAKLRSRTGAVTKDLKRGSEK